MLVLISLLGLARAEPVVAAARTLPIGTVIGPRDLYVADLPADFIPDQAIRDPELPIGLLVREQIERDDLLRPERFAPREAGVGLAALLPRGMRAVTVALPHPMPHLVADTLVDVARADRGCVVVQAASVLRVEPRLIQLAVTPEQVAGFVDLPPDAARIWVRNPIDLEEVGGMPSCFAPPAPALVRREGATVVQAPSGKAQARELLRGENAWLGELWLDPGGKVPTHRDETEEYLIVLAGSGTMTVDGKTYEVTPGTAVYMPAHAEVSYVNGSERLHVIQVFAGPAPAKKYDTWKPVP